MPDIDMYIALCPSTSKPCYKDIPLDCIDCEVEKEEVEWMKKMEGDDDE